MPFTPVLVVTATRSVYLPFLRLFLTFSVVLARPLDSEVRVVARIDLPFTRRKRSATPLAFASAPDAVQLTLTDLLAPLVEHLSVSLAGAAPLVVVLTVPTGAAACGTGGVSPTVPLTVVSTDTEVAAGVGLAVG